MFTLCFPSDYVFICTSSKCIIANQIVLYINWTSVRHAVKINKIKHKTLCDDTTSEIKTKGEILYVVDCSRMCTNRGNASFRARYNG